MWEKHKPTRYYGIGNCAIYTLQHISQLSTQNKSTSDKQKHTNTTQHNKSTTPNHKNNINNP